MLFAVVLLGSVGCDQATKQLARAGLAGSSGLSLASDVVRLELHANPGAFLGLGAALPPTARRVLVIGVPPLALGLVVLLALRAGLASPAAWAALALVVGGGLGNWLDRLLHGGVVTDFVQLGVGPIHTGVFNLADVCIVSGAVLLVLVREAKRLAP